MNITLMEKVSRLWIETLERRKGPLSYAFVWYLLGLGTACILFSLIDKVWLYGLEGALVCSGAVLLFIVETCWRRIVELKGFLSEYIEQERKSGSIGDLS